ncbi:MarR family winged helix-turn-helix transcriptional regulator [Clostridium tarantellae]|uniref:HTH-type transcriptional regulator SarZ n=1 Tax=Clostridium tarantellae TaxID=39493 RepID=A0A6I1MR54_9CLOT|nr:MarR family winged helix-turn-helix transcriptional regulator [Clostridium tarantellae]MPQ44948.1 MarR family transcriptional regulator [Clostridium tarantellae]
MNDKYIVHFMSKTKKKMIKFIQKELAENNLKEIDPSYGNILTALYESNKPLTMNEIVKKTSKDKSTITALVKKLLDLGYVKKFKSTEDNRVTFIVLTEKAEGIKETYTKISKNLNKTVYSGFSDSEKKVFLDLLKRINDNLNNI